MDSPASPASPPTCSTPSASSASACSSSSRCSIPPIPSEVILPFAGYLSQAGELQLGWLIVWSTARIARRRAAALLARRRRSACAGPSDLDRAHAARQPHRPRTGRRLVHPRTVAWSVLVGRIIPGVRSLISMPAGAARMGLARFCVVHGDRQRHLEHVPHRRRAPRSAPSTSCSTSTSGTSTTWSTRRSRSRSSIARRASITVSSVGAPDRREASHGDVENAVGRRRP